VNELRSTPQEEDALSFWQKRQASYPLMVPLPEDLLSDPASQAYVERVFVSRTEKPLDMESGAASVLELL